MSTVIGQARLPLSVVVEPAGNSNTLVYAPVAPRSAGEKPGVMIAVMFRLTNHGATPLHFQKARFSFAGSPFVADALYTQDDVLGELPAAVTMNPGRTRSIHFSRLVTIRCSAPAPQGVSIQIFCEESALPVTVFRALAPHANPVAGGAYRLPFKAADLGAAERRHARGPLGEARRTGPAVHDECALGGAVSARERRAAW